MAMHVRAVIFDWAGTLVDFGSVAPVIAMREIFAAEDVQVEEPEARLHTGLPKAEHIREIGHIPRVADRWFARHGERFSEADAERLYRAFGDVSRRIACQRGRLVSGVLETVRGLRESGILIGTTTGYPAEVMTALAAVAEAQGFIADTIVCTDEVPLGRPSPLAVYECMVRLAVWPPATIVKVDDSLPGIEEGIRAGAWTVGVSASGNGVGLDEDTYLALPEEERRARTDAAARHLADAGADYVIGSVAELPGVIADIDERLAEGERPPVPDA